MKKLKISIFSLFACLVFGDSNIMAQPLSLKLGIYQFTDNAASEFYLLSPTLLIGYDVWESSRLGLQISSGFSYTQIKYNSNVHRLYMIPLMATVNYDIPNPNSRVWPCVGMGFSILGKADDNKSMHKTHYSLLYGYHTNGGLRFKLKNDLIITFDLTYNLLIPPSMEEVNMNGVIIALGLQLPIKYNE